MFLSFHKIALIFLHLAIVTLTTEHIESTFGLNPNVGPPLTDFMNATELAFLHRTVTSEYVTWVDATNAWPSYRKSEPLKHRIRDRNSKLAGRYVDLGTCFSAQRRVVVRNQLHAIVHMLLDAQTNLTLSHPIWRALVAPQFQDDPRALERVNWLFSVIYDTITNSAHTITLSCDAATPQCARSRNAPPDGREQVPAGYFDIDDSIVNLCNNFFVIPHLAQMKCEDATSMSFFESTGMSLYL